MRFSCIAFSVQSAEKRVPLPLRVVCGYAVHDDVVAGNCHIHWGFRHSLIIICGVHRRWANQKWKNRANALLINEHTIAAARFWFLHHADLRRAGDRLNEWAKWRRSFRSVRLRFAFESARQSNCKMPFFEWQLKWAGEVKSVRRQCSSQWIEMKIKESCVVRRGHRQRKRHLNWRQISRHLFFFFVICWIWSGKNFLISSASRVLRWLPSTIIHRPISREISITFCFLVFGNRTIFQHTQHTLRPLAKWGCRAWSDLRSKISVRHHQLCHQPATSSWKWILMLMYARTSQRSTIQHNTFWVIYYRRYYVRTLFRFHSNPSEPNNRTLCFIWIFVFSFFVFLSNLNKMHIRNARVRRAEKTPATVRHYSPWSSSGRTVVAGNK